MAMTIFILCVVSSVLVFISSFTSRKPTKRGKRILAAILFFAAIISGWLSYRASIATDDQLQSVDDQASEAIVRADKAQAQITEIRTPRRMELETKRMLVVRLKPYAG